MKYLFFSISILMTLTCPGQTIKEGDKLNELFKKVEKPYYVDAPELTPWIDGSNLLLIASDPKVTNCEYLFIALKDSTLIGVFKQTEPNSFLLDTQGNGTLSGSTDIFLLPHWVVKSKTTIDAEDKTVLNLLNEMYEQTLQADDSQIEASSFQLYERFKTDTTLANRHIIELFDSYQTLITETAVKGLQPPLEVSIPLMKTLAGECIQLYNQIPAMICIYMGEALQSAGFIEEARNHFKMCLDFYPNSIPILVYNYQLEKDSATKKKQLSKLKKNHPNHWMVKDL